MTLFDAAIKSLAKRYGDRIVEANAKAEISDLCAQLERAYQRCERAPREIKQRKQIAKVSKKRAKLNRSVRSFRDEARSMVCECCQVASANEWHEIASGPDRRKTLTERCAILALCRECHRDVQNWKKPKQLALLWMHRPEDFDLSRFNALCGRAAGAITMLEVEAEFVALS